MPTYLAPSASSGLAASFAVLAVLVIIGFASLVGLARRSLGHAPIDARRTAFLTGAAFASWAAVFVVLAVAGVLSDFERRPPPGLLMMVAILVASIATARSRIGTYLADGLATPLLIGLQAFRFPLELAMHRAAHEGVMPTQMTFTGMNFDIVSGVVALAIVLAYRKREPPRAVTIGFSILGTTLLAAILVIALASTPPVRAFGDDPSVVNSFVFHAPFVVLPSVLVFAALVGQFVLFRRIAHLVRTGESRAVTT